MRIALPEAHQLEPLRYLADSYAPEMVQAGFAFSDVTYRLSKLPMRVFEEIGRASCRERVCYAV